MTRYTDLLKIRTVHKLSQQSRTKSQSSHVIKTQRVPQSQHHTHFCIHHKQTGFSSQYFLWQLTSGEVFEGFGSSETGFAARLVDAGCRQSSLLPKRARYVSVPVSLWLSHSLKNSITPNVRRRKKRVRVTVTLLTLKRCSLPGWCPGEVAAKLEPSSPVKTLTPRPGNIIVLSL